MNVVESEHSRYVVPQWTPFAIAAAQPEIRSFGAVARANKKLSQAEFLTDLQDFREKPTPHLASDLMGVAVVLGQDDIARELAQYVGRYPALGPVALKMAAHVAGGFTLTSEPSIEQYRREIQRQKKFLAEFGRDPIVWIERALNYALLGMNDKAKRCVVVALNLAPRDRYVVRSAIRFFIHIDDWGQAFHYARIAASGNNDPWIVAPFLTVATHLQKLPSSIKPLLKAAIDSNEHFHYSELREAFGTLEILHGADARARKIFRQAWIEPAKSVITHSQWVLREKLPGLSGSVTVDFTQSSQAMSWIKSTRLDFAGALACLRNWAFEEPYSVAPYLQMSWIECLEDRFGAAVQTLKSGLVANPKDLHLHNNLAFALLKLGKDREAAEAFATVKASGDFEEDVAYLATNGLLLMRRGELGEGRRYYGDALQKTKKRKERILAIRVVLNYLASELDVTGTVDGRVLEVVTRALKGERDSSVLGTTQSLRRRLQAARAGVEDAKLRTRIDEFVAISTAEENALRSSLDKSTGTGFPPVDAEPSRLRDATGPIFEAELFPALKEAAPSRLRAASQP